MLGWCLHGVCHQVHGVYSDFVQEIQEKYQRALAAAPELMPWAQGLLPPEARSWWTGDQLDGMKR